MKNITALITFLGLFTQVFTQTIDWAKMIDDKDITVITTKTNSSGDLIVFGTFTGTVDFDPGSATYNLVSAGGADLFIARYKNNGTFSFAKRLGNSSTETGFDMTVDKNNYIIISGKVSGTVDMNPSTSTSNIGTSGNTTSFLARYSSTGTFSWVKSFSSSINFTAITTDGTSRVLATGYFSGTTDFNPSSTTNNLSSVSGSTDIFLAAYSSTGTYVWANGIGNSNSTERSFDICVDNSNFIYITGIFKGTVDFNPDPSHESEFTSNSGNSDMFVGKYHKDGWAWIINTASGSGVIEPKQICVSSDKDIYVSGLFSKSLNVNGVSFTSSSSSKDIFVIKYLGFNYDPFGNTEFSYRWSKKIGGVSNENIASMDLDDDGNPLLLGEFSGTVDFNPNTGTQNLTASGPKDLFFAKLTSEDGDYLFADNIGNSNSEIAKSVAYNKSDNVFFLMGDFYGTVSFNIGSSSGSAVSLTTPSSTSKRTFITKYSISNTALQEIAPHEQTAEFMQHDLGLPISPAVKIMPNPTSDETNLQFEGISVSNTSQIRVFDFSGREVLSNMYELELYGVTAKIDVTKLTSGLYIITVESNGHVVQNKFIKQ